MTQSNKIDNEVQNNAVVSSALESTARDYPRDYQPSRPAGAGNDILVMLGIVVAIIDSGAAIFKTCN